jgi:hypothetical protein
VNLDSNTGSDLAIEVLQQNQQLQIIKIMMSSRLETLENGTENVKSA